MRTLVEICVNKKLKDELEEGLALFDKLSAIKLIKTIPQIGLAEARDIFMKIIETKGESHICVGNYQKEWGSIDSDMPKSERPKMKIQVGPDMFFEIKKVAEQPFYQLHELLENSIGSKFYNPYIGELEYKGIYNFFEKDDRIYSEEEICPADSLYRKKLVFESKKFKELEYPQLFIANIDGSSIETNRLMVFPDENEKDWLNFIKPWIPRKGERVWAKNPGGLWIGCYFHSTKNDNEMYVCEPRKSRDERDFVEKLTFSKCVPFEPIPW